MVTLNDYEELKGYIDRMRHGEKDVLWPGRVKWYAKSSGTTNDKSKFIPVSQQGLQDIHYAGGRDAVVLYLRNNPQSRFFDGRGLILGGSHSPNYNLPHSLVGDLSAILIENINPLVNLIRVPSKKTALLSDFEVKRDRIAREAMTATSPTSAVCPRGCCPCSPACWSSRARSTWTRCGPTSKCSSTAAWPSLPIASNIAASSKTPTCTTKRLTTPARVSSDCRATPQTRLCC